MNYKREPAGPAEKERIRAEIEAQVREYLRRGGRINEVTGLQLNQVRAIGETWSVPFDESLAEP